ncbi:hypothetical protein ACHWQZ_G010095 [Mnemiopsis leidyi]
MKLLLALSILAVLSAVTTAKCAPQPHLQISGRVGDIDWPAYYGEIFDYLEAKNFRAVMCAEGRHFKYVRDTLRPLCTTPGDLSDMNCLIVETHMNRLYELEKDFRCGNTNPPFINPDDIDWNDPKNIQLRGYMLMWFTMTPLNIKKEVSADDRFTIISILQQQIYTLVLKNDINGLLKFLEWTRLPTLQQIRKINKGRCTKASNWANDLGCAWESLQNDLHLFISAHRSKAGKVKRISVLYDYKERLKQQQLKNLIEGAVLEINSNIEEFTEQVTSVVNTNFDSVGNYFTTLAEFDGELAAIDIAYIQSELEKYDRKLVSLNWALSYDAEMIAEMAVISAGLDAALAWVKAIADMAIGIFSAIGGEFGDLSNAFDSMNDATQATINAIRAGTIPNLIKGVAQDSQKIFQGFKDNDNFLDQTAKLLKLESENGIEDIESVRQAFLDRYNEFDPQVGVDDIAKIGIQWETIVDLIADTLEGITQAGASGGKAVIYAENYIERMKFYIPQISALLQSRFDFQFDLMDTLAAYLRAKLAESSVKALKGSIEEMKDSAQDVKIVKKQAALSTLVVSRVHTLTALQLHCNIMEYKNAGEVPTACSNALTTLNDEDIADAITFLPESCTVNPDGKYVSIPVSKKGRLDAINLEDLYSGNQTTFRIPNAQWLVDYGWMLPSDAKEKVFYVKGFEIFLVSSKESMRSLYLGVDVIAKGSAALIKDGNPHMRYEITSEQEYDFRYKENERPCDRKFPNPHEWCDNLGHVCVTDDGLLDNKLDVYPSIYSEWSINVNDVELSRLPKMPQFVEEDETLFLQAKVWLCSKKPSKMPPIDVKRPPIDDDEAQECGANNYYDRKTRSWKSCPFGSVERLGGYYCEHKPCWKQHPNMGGYPSGGVIAKKTVSNKDECMDLCEEDTNCKAALLSSSNECHIVNSDETDITPRKGWSAAIKQKCADWAVTRRFEEPIPWNFATHTLQIRSDDKTEYPHLQWIYVFFMKDPETEPPYSGGFRIKLGSNPPEYSISNCHGSKRFSTSLPHTRVKVWTVDWDADNLRLTIFCNGQKVVDTVLSDRTCRYNDWKEGYPGGFKYITFPDFDTESDFYRHGDKTNRT